MTDRPSDHWNDLASNLGATPAEESPQPSAGPSEAEAAVPDSSRKEATDAAALPARPAPPRPKPQRASDWGSLASELGIEVPAEPVEGEAAKPSPIEQASPTAPLREEAPFAPMAESTSSSLTVEDIWPDMAQPEAEKAAPAEAEPPTPGSTEFGAGLTAELDAVAGNAASAPLDPAHDETTAEESDTEAPRKKSRRRRRRRKPRSDEQADKTTEAATTRDSDQDTDDDEDDQERTSRRRPRRRKPRSDSDETTDRSSDESAVADRDPDDDTDDEHSRGGRTKKAGHKQIPTWEEAIGIIVEKNLASRSRRGGGGGGGSRSRGRRSSGNRRK